MLTGRITGSEALSSPIGLPGVESLCSELNPVFVNDRHEGPLVTRVVCAAFARLLSWSFLILLLTSMNTRPSVGPGHSRLALEHSPQIGAFSSHFEKRISF